MGEVQTNEMNIFDFVMPSRFMNVFGGQAKSFGKTRGKNWPCGETSSKDRRGFLWSEILLQSHQEISPASF